MNRHERLKTLLLETLSIFKRLNENIINQIVTLFHYSGEINAGHIGLSQGDPYSVKWEVIMSELEQENLVVMEQKGYREYFLKKKYNLTNDYRKILEELRQKSYNDIRRVALDLHTDAIQKKRIAKLGIEGLREMLNV